jgi:hypothetical protein
MKPMPSALSRAALAVLLVCGASVVPAAGQPQGERRAPAQPAQPAQAPPPGSRLVVDRMDAEATRRELMDVLRGHPPSVGRVLKLDPSLLQNESYLEPYPQLRAFLAEHPEIHQNAAYYLEPVRGIGEDYTPPTPNQRMLENFLAGLAGLTAFAVGIGTLIWLIRTVLDHRRWNRLSKIQAEVHTKLMDRFSSNEELLTYVQTPSGRRFLESGPSPLQEAMPAMSAPFARILWSVQAGAVLLVTGLGLLFLSGRAIPEVSDFFYIAGCLATALGAGFIVSAAAAYVLSRRLGLLEPPAQSNA